MGILLAGCATYPPDATKKEIWQARYDQNIIKDDDSSWESTCKMTRHVLWDICTLGFAEIHYGRIRYNYRHILEREAYLAKRKVFLDGLVGKNLKNLLAEFGTPESVTDVGGGDQMFVWSKRTLRTTSFGGSSGNVSSSGTYTTPSYPGGIGTTYNNGTVNTSNYNTSVTREEVKKLWFLVGPDHVAKEYGVSEDW